MKFSNTWFPSDAEPIWRKHLLPLAETVDTYLELGTCEAASLIWVLDNLRPTTAFAVDAYKPDRARHADAFAKYRENAIANLDEWNGALGVGHDHWYRWKEKADVRLFLEDTHQWLCKHQDAKLIHGAGDVRADLVYVDASHVATDALLDMQLAWRLLKPNGLMVVDDMNRTWNLGRAETRVAVWAFEMVYTNFAERFFLEGRQIAFRKVKP